MDSIDSNEPRLPARLPTPRPDYIAPARALPDDAPQRSVSVRTAVRGVVRYRWLVAVLWLIATPALVAVIYTRIRPSYDAVSLLRIDPASQNIFGATMMADGASRAFMNTQVKLILSTNVLLAASHDPAVAKLPLVQQAEDPVAALRDAIQVIALPDSHLIQVTMSSKMPGEAATAINAVVAEFLKSNNTWTEANTGNAKKNYDAFRKDLAQQLAAKDKEWEALAARSNVNPLDRPRPAEPEAGAKAPADASKPEAGRAPMIAQEDFRKLRAKSIDVTMELLQAQSILASEVQALANLEAQAAQAGQDGPNDAALERRIEEEFRKDLRVQAIVDRVNNLNDKLGRVGRVARNAISDPSTRGIALQIETQRAAYDRLWEQEYPTLKAALLAGSAPGRAVVDPRQAVRDAEHRVIQLRATKASVDELMAKSDVESKQDATDAVRLAIVQEEREDLRMSIGRIAGHLHQIGLDAKREAQISQQDAAVIGAPSGDKRKLYMAAAPMGVLGALLGLVILLEIRAGRVAHPDDLASRVRAEVFSVPPLPSAPRPSRGLKDLRSREDQVEEFAQRVDHLRVSICGDAPDGIGRCVMITSATSGEGKTTLAAQLAMRCANAGSSTILIDADLRRATLGRLLDVPGGPGLADVLVGDCDLDAASVVIGEAGGFNFLPAGTPGHDPSRVFRGPALGRLLEQLREAYDVVIVDTPPVLPVPDALTLGRWVDGAVLSVRSDASRFQLVERANRSLASAGIELLGVVINGVRTSEAAYKGANYSGYADRNGRSASTEVAPT
jgi:succinoglycan biosynthesis transport protein ExoP